MEWIDGVYFIASFQEAGVTYNLWLRKYCGIPATIWQFFLSKGDWQVANPQNIWAALTDETKIPKDPNATTEEIFASLKVQIIDPLNAFLKDYFKEIDIPETLFERVEAIIKSLIFFRDAAGKPQIKIQ